MLILPRPWRKEGIRGFFEHLPGVVAAPQSTQYFLSYRQRGASPHSAHGCPAASSAYDQRGLAPWSRVPGLCYPCPPGGLAGALLPQDHHPPVRAGAVAGRGGEVGHGAENRLERGSWDMPSKRQRRDWLGARLLAGQLVTEDQTPA